MDVVDASDIQFRCALCKADLERVTHPPGHEGHPHVRCANCSPKGWSMCLFLSGDKKIKDSIMGMIRIEIVGSFSRGGMANFPAQHHGHADAVAQAIAYLSGTVLPLAIKQDHELHDEDARPDFGFGRDPHKKEAKSD